MWAQFARLVIPKDLSPLAGGKTERRMAPGPDYQAALKARPGAVAVLQPEIVLAERRTSMSRIVSRSRAWCGTAAWEFSARAGTSWRIGVSVLAHELRPACGVLSQ